MSTMLSEPSQLRKRRVTSRCVAVLVLALLLCYLLWSPASGGDIDGAPFHGRSGQTEQQLLERTRGAKGGHLAETMNEAGACSSTKRLQGDKGTWGAEADAILRREAAMLALPDTTDVVSKLRRVLSTPTVRALLSLQARDSSSRKGTAEYPVEVQNEVGVVAKVERPAIPSDAPASFDVLRAQDNIVADLRAVRRRAAARRVEAYVVAHYRALVPPSVLNHLPTENDLKMGFGARSPRPRDAVSSLDLRDAFEHYGVLAELQQHGAEECAAAASSANVSIWSAHIAWSAEVSTYTPEQRRAMLLFTELLIAPGSTAATVEKTPVLSLESLTHRAQGEKNGPGLELSREGRASRFQRLTRWLLPAHAPLDLGECTAVGHKNDRPAHHNGGRVRRVAGDRQPALSDADTIDADTGDAVQRLEARIESIPIIGASTLGSKGKTTAAAHDDVDERDKAGVFRVVSQGVNRAVLRNVCVSPHGGGLSGYAVPLMSQRTGASMDRVRLFKHPGASRDHTLRGSGEGRLSMVKNFTADVQDLFSIGEDLDTGESKAARKARRRRSLFFVHQDKVAEAKAKAGHKDPSTRRAVQGADGTSPQRHSDGADAGNEKARVRSLPAVLWSTTHVDERGNVVKGVFVSRRRRPPPPRCIVKRTVPFVFPVMYQSNNIGHALFREMAVRRAVQAFESEEQQQSPNGRRGNSPHHSRREREPVLLYYVTPDARSTFDSTTAHRLFHSLWRRGAGTQRPQHSDNSNATSAPPYKWFSVLGSGHESGRIRRQSAASILGPHALRSSAPWQSLADGRGDGDEVCFAELHVSWDVLPMYAKSTAQAVVKDRENVRRAFVDLRARVSQHLLGLPPLTARSTAGTATPPGHVRVLLVDRSYRRMRNLYTEILPSLVRTNTTRLTFVGRRVRALARAAGLVIGPSTSAGERDDEKVNGTASGVVGMDITVVDFAAVEVEHQAALVAQHDILLSTHGTALQWAFGLRAGREAVAPQSSLSPHGHADVSRPIPVLVEVQYKHYGCALPGVGPPNAAECEFGQSAAAAGAEYIVWRAPPGDASACAAVPRGCDVAPRPAAFAELLRVAVCVHRRGSGRDCGPRHADFFS